MSKQTTHPDKLRRRTAAAARQASYDSLTLPEKIRRAQNAPGSSTRELARLRRRQLKEGRS
jgi:hypothetical protein